jgi:cell division protein FtsB
MTDVNAGTEKATAETTAGPLANRVFAWAHQHGWRPAGTAVAVVLALLLMWHVVNGKNGLTAWHQKRSADKQLQLDIKQLEQENAQLRQHVERLRTDPEAIEHEARERLHYAKPNEVIVALPAQSHEQSQPAGTGR